VGDFDVIQRHASAVELVGRDVGGALGHGVGGSKRIV
jgi:hypothetical protein